MIFLPTILVNGYAYPFISQDILREWLPSLTYTASFSYGFTPNGDIVNLNDDAVLNTVQQSGGQALMVLTPFDDDGNFNSNLISELLNNDVGTERIIENILTVLRSKGFAGVDFDFEYLLPQERDKYTALVRRSREILNNLGYLVTVTLAPKTSTEQKGLLYEGHDYKGMGEAANYVLLMTYEWGYMFGPPMAVAPYNQVRRVIEYGLTQIPPEKIWMGMANYGYDWTLPFIQGESKAERLSNPEAEARAARYGAVIHFDEPAQSPYYTYTDSQGNAHEVWFENAASWRAKLNLIPEFNLAGIGIWNVMDRFPQGMTLLNQMFTIAK